MISVTALLLLYLSVTALGQQRHKDKDDAYVDLIALNLITEGCSADSYYGYGIVDGSLEKCDKYEEAKSGGGEVSAEYEEIKCRTLRVHGRMVDGKCECKSGWKGPYCNEYNGCPAGFSLYNSVLDLIYYYFLVFSELVLQMHVNIMEQLRSVPNRSSASVKHHGMVETASDWLAGEWHPKHERRWRNARDKCRCADEYDGENCDKVVACKNDGELIDGRVEIEIADMTSLA
ncbi:unnamed protein product [Anisakis simplex]|uniref:EGF-like domain-containing protein n=1 Tax=Anisakis simplex TaxID=6269 RepID=A0A0M3JVI9_ANISI|nr:unnamed protein product [Anisakis simplex]